MTGAIIVSVSNLCYSALVLSHELLNLSHHPIEFVDKIGMIAMLAKCGHKRAVIPKRAVFFP